MRRRITITQMGSHWHSGAAPDRAVEDAGRAAIAMAALFKGGANAIEYAM